MFPLPRFHSLSFPLFRHFLCFVLWHQASCCCCSVSNDSVFGVSIELMLFQMSLLSNDSTLNSVFKCLRFRSFSVATPTQKWRHSTPFSLDLPKSSYKKEISFFLPGRLGQVHVFIRKWSNGSSICNWPKHLVVLNFANSGITIIKMVKVLITLIS